jgi:hypothetical protein
MLNGGWWQSNVKKECLNDNSLFDEENVPRTVVLSFIDVCALFWGNNLY